MHNTWPISCRSLNPEYFFKKQIIPTVVFVDCKDIYSQDNEGHQHKQTKKQHASGSNLRVSDNTVKFIVVYIDKAQNHPSRTHTMMVNKVSHLHLHIPHVHFSCALCKKFSFSCKEFLRSLFLLMFCLLTIAVLVDIIIREIWLLMCLKVPWSGWHLTLDHSRKLLRTQLFEFFKVVIYIAIVTSLFSFNCIVFVSLTIAKSLWGQ